MPAMVGQTGSGYPSWMERWLKWVAVLQAALLAVLLVGGTAAAVAGKRAYDQLVERQRAMDAALAPLNREIKTRLLMVRDRRANLDSVAKGLGKFDEMIRLMQLMADEQLLLLEWQLGTSQTLQRALEAPEEARARTRAPRGHR